MNGKFAHFENEFQHTTEVILLMPEEAIWQLRWLFKAKKDSKGSSYVKTNTDRQLIEAEHHSYTQRIW